ncbi:Nitric oxide-responding transcriptional regulator Dnr (Crp/Fnr family) [hydrothermal vent metagenome]|uniref:Nitric oxide-responding transcriptional regulator Dnr (Crp/Fnr family) n=1 Tax=hydrothermal vent metagenome TaxID=652676 RepID=A0A1W1BRK7_9ZZZZ
MTKTNLIAKRISFIIIALLLTSDLSMAKDKKLSTLELINIAGQQRMLSQRISKDYLYKGGNIAVSKATRQLAQTLKSSILSQQKLESSIKDEKILNLLEFVQMNNEDIIIKTKDKFTIDNAEYVLDLSESMLEGNEYVMKALKKSEKIGASSTLVDISSRQSMLAQRISKYYIAYQLGIKDDNTINQMNKAVGEFTKNHKILLANSSNTEEINKKLQKVDRLWSVVYKFYLDIEAGGLPLIVFNTADDITKKMTQITNLFSKLDK